MLIIIQEPDVEIAESDLSTSWIAANILRECSINPMPTARLNRGMLSPELYRIAATTDSSLECFIATVWMYESMAVVCTTKFDPALTSSGLNKPHYREHRRRSKVLFRCRIDPVCYRLYQALFCYNKRQYDRCITLVQKSKDTISTLRSVYRWNLSQEMYTEAGGEELPLPAIMRRAVIDLVRVGKDRPFPDFNIEIYSCPVSAQKLAIAIPPLVFALFLQCLSYTNSDISKRETRL